VEVPLPWERLLWRGRAVWPLGTRYALTDFRVIVDAADRSDEIAIQDISDVHRQCDLVDRILGTSTLVVRNRRGSSPLVIAHVRRGIQLAALLELLAGDAQASLDPPAVHAALAWTPRRHPIARARAAYAIVVLPLVALAAVIGSRRSPATAASPSDDAIYTGGHKRDREAIVAFMEAEVMPWARVALAPIVGGAAAVTCETCHGPSGYERGWQMPAVAALPAPHFRALGWETYSAGMNPQVRNAIYGYMAEADKQHKAGYMREVVMPGMARLLRRPAYDFTRSYDYNRARDAFGCYHCHRMEGTGVVFSASP
jgi:hypothetical protein